jgi:hypothetical protein
MLEAILTQPLPQYSKCADALKFETISAPEKILRDVAVGFQRSAVTGRAPSEDFGSGSIVRGPLSIEVYPVGLRRHRKPDP